MTFAACAPVTLASEGGYVVDDGGPTNHGVTIPMWAAYKRVPPSAISAADIQALTIADVMPFYEVEFYNPAHCPDCPAGLDLMVFDEAVNEGQGHAIRHLQAAVGVAADGLYGPATARAVEGCDPVAAIHAIHDGNAAYYKSLDDAAHHKYEDGWQARNDRTRDIALQMAAAAVAGPTPAPDP